LSAPPQEPRSQLESEQHATFDLLTHLMG